MPVWSRFHRGARSFRYSGAIGLRKRKRTQEQAIHQREDHDVRGDAEAEHRDNERRADLLPAEQSKRGAELGANHRRAPFCRKEENGGGRPPGETAPRAAGPRNTSAGVSATATRPCARAASQRVDETLLPFPRHDARAASPARARAAGGSGGARRGRRSCVLPARGRARQPHEIGQPLRLGFERRASGSGQPVIPSALARLRPPLGVVDFLIRPRSISSSRDPYRVAGHR